MAIEDGSLADVATAGEHRAVNPRRRIDAVRNDLQRARIWSSETNPSPLEHSPHRGS
jgi:hypothetical protein